MTDTLLTVHGLNTGYGAVQVLFDVAFGVRAGTVTTLVGANGAGKSTIMKTLAGLVAPRAGSLLYDGREIAGLASHERVDAGLCLIPEGRLVFPGMTVEQNLRLGAVSPKARSGHEEMLAEVYRRFPRLQERRRQLAGLMSGGEQQMLGLAPVMVKQVFEIIRELRDAGFTILLAEQNARVALELADHAYLLENGRVGLSGTGQELLEAPEVRRAYLGM
jgi:branched-chain amino acid transport system ATP-binding protein